MSCIALTAEPAPILVNFHRAALVVIDMQNDFLHPDGWFPASGLDASPLRTIIPTVQDLASGLRSAGVPVIWLNWGVRPGAPEVPETLKRKGSLDGRRPTYGDPSTTGRGHILVQGDWGAQTIEELAPKPGDRLVYKHRLTGFYDNEFDSVLRNLSIDTLLFAGVNIDRCVYATLSDAAVRGYQCVLVEDACATGSPAAVRDSILFLVRLLHGATTNSHCVHSALKSFAEG